MNAADVTATLDQMRPETVTGQVSTGSLGLDFALGGGYPAGKISELYGEQKTGRTAMALAAAAKAKGPVLWLSSMADFSPRRAKKAGLDMGNVVYAQAESDLHALLALRVSAESCPFMVLDSLGGMAPEPQSNATTYRHRLGMLQNDLRKTGSTVLIVGETSTYRDFPMAVRETAVCRVKLSGNGTNVRATVEKAPASTQMQPFHVPGFSIRNGCIDTASELVSIATDRGLIEKRGGWFYYGRILGNGLAQAAASVWADQALARELTEALMPQ